MLEILQYSFMQNALIAGVLIAVICSVMGVFLVLRRMSLIGDGLAHISFGGIAAGFFFGVYPLLSALIFAVLAAFGIERLKKMKVYGDAAIAIFFSFGLALGVVIISFSKGFTADLFSYLFGSILAVSAADLVFILALGLATMAVIWAFYKELLYITFDEDSARASGIAVERVNMLLIILTAMAVVIAMRIVGILLVSSFIVIPASIALLLCKNFRQAMLVSVAIGISSSILGLFASYYLDLAAGGAIVLVLVALFFAALVYKKLRTE
ncbi:MAG: metal ABC transporter permease [Candidatus ainarchaeum sp.]|nr:metal ABC transporter permease [Candidatus ainarchaeum sp.]